MRKRKPVSIPSLEQVEAEREKIKYRKRYRRTLSGTLGVLAVAAAAAVLVATLVLPTLRVSGKSMEPTLQDGDVVVLLKQKSFDTGDLVGLYHNGKILLKRVIAGAGDWVNVDEDGNVFVNDEPLTEPYVTEKSLGLSDITYPYQVPDGSWFVMGDHRAVSVDSRNSAVGCISQEQIIGRIVFRIWPLKNLSAIS